MPHFCEIAHLRAHALMGESSGHREDATCCLGRGTGTALPPATGCGGCGHRESAPALLQVESLRGLMEGFFRQADFPINEPITVGRLGSGPLLRFSVLRMQVGFFF